MKLSLRAARINAGLTQDNVASILKMSKHTLGNWERGKSRVPFYGLATLATLYSVEITDFKIHENY